VTERIYDPAIHSDGLTVDSGRGPVDLVVIERALRGLPVRPTGAETTHLAALVPLDDRTVAQRIADATGVTLEAVLRRATRARTRQHA
jgi:hypothetical protein